MENKYFFKFPHSSEDSFSLSVGDLMAALLLIFILLLSSTLLRLEEQFEEKQQVAEKYRDLQQELYEDLLAEFQDDLSNWSAIIKRETLSIQFNEPEVLFEPGEDVVQEKFKEIIDDFFPRYITLLNNSKYRDNIEEIRIEGHTSSEWIDADYEEAYFLNMKLSQDRTRNVLDYAISTLQDEIQKEWARSHIIASGLSSSKLVIVDGKEDKEASRRVEFRVRTNAEKQISEILQLGENK